MTNREFLNAVMEIENVPADVAGYARESIEKLDEANEKRRNKLTKTQLANAPLIAKFVAALTPEAQTASDFAAKFGVSVQKASSLLRTIVADGKAEKMDVKIPKKGTQKAYKLPDTVEAEAEVTAEE